VLRYYYDVDKLKITTVPPPEFAALNLLPGASMSARVTYDLATLDQNPSVSRGQYAAIVSAEMAVGELDLHYHGGFNNIETRTGANPSDRGTSIGFGLGGSSDILIILGGLELTGGPLESFPTDALLSGPPPLSSVDPFDPSNPHLGTRAVLDAATASANYSIVFQLTELYAVPEPNLSVLLPIALSSLMSRRRRPTSHSRV